MPKKKGNLLLLFTWDLFIIIQRVAGVAQWYSGEALGSIPNTRKNIF
jgi:hypothetical protein